MDLLVRIRVPMESSKYDILELLHFGTCPKKWKSLRMASAEISSFLALTNL